MSAGAGLPSKRWSLRGSDEEGNEVWLIRSFGQKLYRCPGCHGDIPIGAEHTVVQYVLRLGGTEHHHWHGSAPRNARARPARPEAGARVAVVAGRSSSSAAGARRTAARNGDGIHPPIARVNAVSTRMTVFSLYLRIWRTYFAWAGTLLPLAFVVFVPLGLFHAIPVHVEATSLTPGSGLAIFGVFLALLLLVGPG